MSAACAAATSTAAPANPTRTALEGNIAALEEGERGFAFASGLAAEDTVVRGLLNPGDHVVLPNDAYGGTHRLFDKVEQRWGLANTPAALSDLDAVRAAIRPETKMIWVETPTNPLLGIADIEALANLAHEAGALLVVDNTFATPVPPAPADPGRRRRHPLDHQVRRRAQRRRRRRGRRARPRARREGRLPPERHGRGGRAVRRLADPARPQDARGPDGPALRQRREGRRVPHRRRADRARLLPGPREPPRPRGRRAADVAVRRHGELPDQGRRGAGPPGVRAHRGVHARPSRSAASSRSSSTPAG